MTRPRVFLALEVLGEDVLKKYLEAGRIAAEVRERASRIIEPGKKLLEICEYAERLTRDMGGQPAFPCNISVNQVAAHYSPLYGDESLVPEESVVKLDIGVHVDGYIADTAVTVSFNDKYTKLLEAVSSALGKALEKIAPGTRFSEIGRVVENTIKQYGYRPIRNLTGHSISRYEIHAGESIPNTGSLLGLGSFKPGRVYAIEPFGTDGEGYVVEGGLVTIYALRKREKKRLTALEKKIVSEIDKRFKTLPFSERWLVDVARPETLRRELRRLAAKGVLIRYPVLLERAGGIVAQFEHTIIVLEDQVLVTTRKE